MPKGQGTIIQPCAGGPAQARSKIDGISDTVNDHDIRIRDLEAITDRLAMQPETVITNSNGRLQFMDIRARPGEFLTS